MPCKSRTNLHPKNKPQPMRLTKKDQKQEATQLKSVYIKSIIKHSLEMQI